MSTARLSMLFSVLGASACATGQVRHDSETELPVLRDSPLSCVGTMGTSLPALEPPPPIAADDGDGFVARVRLGTIDSERCSALLPRSSIGCAHVLRSDVLEGALVSVAGMPGSRAFAAPDGESRTLATYTETAYVESFRFESVAGAFIADPQIGIYQVGSRLIVEPRRDVVTGAWGLDVELNSVDAESGLEAEGEVLAGVDDVRFDVPVFASMTARTSAALAPGESLILVAPQPIHTDRVLVAVITPEPALRRVAQLE